MRRLVDARQAMESNDDVAALEAAIFGKTLRRIRESRQPKLTQEQLAHAAGLTTNYLSDMERGRKVPSLTTILQLAHALHIQPADLLTDFTSPVIGRFVKERL
jgi:transcriptional regulator with XRE-family HTH domain